MLHVVLVAAWAALVAVAVFAFGIGTVIKATNAPSDVMLLVGNAWSPLGHHDDGHHLVDATVLADGRLAISAVMTSDYTAPRPCDLFDPQSKRWSQGVELVPRRLDTPSGVELNSVERWANVGDGTALILRSDSDGCAVTLEPGAIVLPRLPRCADALAATRTKDGALVIVARFAAEAKTLQLTPGAREYRSLPPPPVPIGLDMLRPFGASGVVAEGSDNYCVLDGEVWRTLPALEPRRYAATIVQMQDGSIVAAGGMLREDRAVLQPVVLVSKVISALVLFALAAIAWRVLAGASRPALVSIALGLAIGWGAFPIFAMSVLKRLAWH